MIEHFLYKIYEFLFSNHNQYKLINLLSINKEYKVKKPLLLFDVGCYIGNWSLNASRIFRLKTKKKIKLFLFDAHKNHEKKIKDKAKKLGDYKFFNVVFDKNKRKRFFYLNQFFKCSGSSLSKVYKNDRMWVLSRYAIVKFFSLISPKKIKKFKKIYIETETVDSFCYKKKINYIDVLKIDVEGSEFDILLGSEKMLNKTKIVYTEIVENRKKYHNKKKKIVMFLKKHGFYLYKGQIIKSVGYLSSLIASDNLFLNKKYFNSDLR